MPEINLSLPPDGTISITKSIEKGASSFAEGVGMTLLIIFLVFLLFLLFAWFFSIVDLLNSEFKDGTTKIVWTIVLIFVPFTALFYIFMANGQKKTIKKSRKRKR